MSRVPVARRVYNLVQRGATVAARPSMTKALKTARGLARDGAPVDIEMCGHVGPRGRREPYECWLQGSVRREGRRTVFSPI